jgi:excisionase family DNA binding protein
MKRSLISVEEATRIYKVSTATVYRWAKEDKLWFVKLNGKKHFDLDTLQRAFNSRHRI